MMKKGLVFRIPLINKTPNHPREKWEKNINFQKKSKQQISLQK